MYLRNGTLYTMLHTKPTDKQHMCLDYHSDPQLSLKESIAYSQFLTMKRVHSESEYLLQLLILLYHYFIQRQYPSQVVHAASEDRVSITKEDLLSIPSQTNSPIDDPWFWLPQTTEGTPHSKRLYQNIFLLGECKCHKGSLPQECDDGPKQTTLFKEQNCQGQDNCSNHQILRQV